MSSMGRVVEIAKGLVLGYLAYLVGAMVLGGVVIVIVKLVR